MQFWIWIGLALLLVSLMVQTKQNNEKIHNYISDVSKGDCIIMGDFNHGNIKWDSIQSTGVDDQRFLCLVHDNFLTQHVLEPTGAARVYSAVLTKRLSRQRRNTRTTGQQRSQPTAF